MKVAQNSVPTESALILARVGLFDHDGQDMAIIVQSRAALLNGDMEESKSQMPTSSRHQCTTKQARKRSYPANQPRDHG